MLQMIVDMMSDAKRLLITSRKKIKYFKKLHEHVPNCIFIQYQIFWGVFFYYFFFLQVVFTLNLIPLRFFSSRQGGDTPLVRSPNQFSPEIELERSLGESVLYEKNEKISEFLNSLNNPISMIQVAQIPWFHQKCVLALYYRLSCFSRQVND